MTLMFPQAPNISVPSKIKGVFLMACAGIFIVPQIVQQFILDQVPITGDISLKRIVYLLTNFPNFYNETILSELARSKMYALAISFFNIVTGLTGPKAFYGFGIVSLVALIAVLMVIWMFSRRISLKYALLGPLFFISTPSLVSPFLGQSELTLIYLFTSLAFFVILFLSPGWKKEMLLLLLFIGIVNSHFMIWLPVFLVILLFEWLYPKFKTWVLLPAAVLISWPLLSPPLAYLSGLKSEWLLAGSIIASVGIFGFYWIRSRSQKLGKCILIIMALIAILVYVLPHKSPTYLVINHGEIKTYAQSFKAINPWNFLFAINPRKDIPGTTTHSILFTALLGWTIYSWKRKKRISPESDKRMKIFLGITFIPIGIILLQFMLLKINYEYFIWSPLGALHPGRISIISFLFWFFPFLSMLTLLKGKWVKAGVTILTLTLILNTANISRFFFLRTQTDASQMDHQISLQKELEEGIKEPILTSETLYGCHFYKKCSSNDK